MKDRQKIFPASFQIHPKSLKSQWLFSCVSLSIIPLIIGLILFFSNVHNYREQTLRNNEALLLQIHDMMDQSFRDTKAIVENLADDSLIPVFYYPNENQNRLIYKLQLKSKLAQYCAYSSYVSGIYIYFPEKQEFITNSTVAPPEILYHAHYNNQNMGYEQWLSIMESPHNGDILLLPASNEKTFIAYMKSIPTFSERINANVIVILDTNTMATMAKNVSGENSCEFNILFGKHPILPLGPLLGTDHELFEKASISSGMSRIEGREKIVLSTLPSDIMEFTYLLATPPIAYQGPIRSVNLLFLAGFLAVILGSIGFTIHFIRKNYKPIQEIVSIANNGQPQTSPEPMDNEYNVIKKALNDSQTASTAMKSQISRQKQQLLDSSLAMLLHRYPIREGSQWDGYRESLDEILHYPCLVMLVFCQDNAGEGERAGCLSSEQMEQLTSWLQREGGFLGNQEIFYWITCLDRWFILLFGLTEKQREGWEFLYSGLMEDVASLAKMRSRLYPDRIICYPSPFCTSLEQLPDAWEETLYIMQYRMVFGIDYTVEHQNAISPVSQDTGYYYPLEEETKLLNLIRSGDKEKAAAVFEGIWQLNLDRDRTDNGFARCLLFDVMGTLMQTCSLITPLSSIEDSIRTTMRKLSSEKNLSNMHRCLLSFLGEVCQIYSNEHSKSTDKLETEIFAYINEHFQNPDLSVEMIGDVFGKSRAYLFSLFKENTGFSMLYHINRIRVEKAKELLLDKNRSIQDIAFQVGFNSSINFTRAFKKYEGITPSKYREVHT